MRWLATLISSVITVSTCFAAEPPVSLSFQRLAGGVDAVAAWQDGTTSLYFVPRAWLSYSVTENLAVKATQGWNTDRGFEPLEVGARIYVPNDPVQVALGVNYIQPIDEVAGHSWSVGLYAGWKVNSRLAGVASVDKDIPLDVVSYKAGLRARVFGGQ